MPPQLVGKYNRMEVLLVIMMDRKKAMKLWNDTIGKEYTRAKDKKGRLVYKEAYGQHGSDYGWDVHHKIPKAKGGTDAYSNLEIVHVITHDEIHGRA
jgi:5-methylcytosine-specific restriction endonuclease McrA